MLAPSRRHHVDVALLPRLINPQSTVASRARMSKPQYQHIPLYKQLYERLPFKLHYSGYNRPAGAPADKALA